MPGAGPRPSLTSRRMAPSPTMTDYRPDSLSEVDVSFLEPFSFPLFPAELPETGDFGSFPIELLGQCHLARHDHDADASLCTPLSPAPSPTLSRESCNCSDDVSASVRALRHRAPSHAIVGDLRIGADLVERLLTCPICYDVSKAPRLTIENVLLIGRLMHEVTTGYRRYLRWVQETRSEHADDNEPETVHLAPQLDSGLTVGFQISYRKFQEVIINGLQADAARLTDLGSRFGLRQHNRHMVGHESCPDHEGRCWRERYDVDNDPLDICPKNAAARTLTPCYRIVDAIRAGIKAFADDVDLNGASLGA